MPRLTAIVWLSWKAAFRYRLVWVLTLLLLGAVVGLPLLVRDDGTAAGFSQIVITYTLGAVSVLLGFTTLWLACGTLARDIEESQMQVVAVKPIPRWQIWLGKWLGIVSLNAALLAASGLCIYSLMLWRAGKLPAAEQKKLYEEILVARASLKEPPVDLGPIIEAKWREKLAQGPLAPDVREFVRRQIEEDVKAQVQLVRPGLQRVWKLDASALKGISPSTLLRVRAKFFAADPSAAGRLNPVYNAMWMIGKPGTPSARRAEMRMAAESHQEFSIPAAAIADDGFLYVGFANPNPVALLFPLEDGFEVLYREGSFALNFARGLLIILFWMSLLAAIGLAAASQLSFPTAAFLAGALMIVVFASGTISSVVEEGSVMGRNHETGKPEHRVVDAVLLPVFKGLLRVVNLTESFSPIESLSTGRSITWGEVSQAFGQIVLLMGGIFGVVGVMLFNRRELAAAQGTS